jgi:hypothetical protein
MWIIVDAVFLAAVVSGMSVRLFLDPRKFVASIGKRIFSISTYSSQIGWLKFIFIFAFNILCIHAFTYIALLKYMIIKCTLLELLIPVILNWYYLTNLQGPKYVNGQKSYSLLSRKLFVVAMKNIAHNYFIAQTDNFFHKILSFVEKI